MLFCVQFIRMPYWTCLEKKDTDFLVPYKVFFSSSALKKLGKNNVAGKLRQSCREREQHPLHNILQTRMAW